MNGTVPSSKNLVGGTVPSSKNSRVVQMLYKSNFVERKTCFYLSRKVISPRDVVGLDLAS